MKKKSNLYLPDNDCEASSEALTFKWFSIVNQMFCQMETDARFLSFQMITFNLFYVLLACQTDSDCVIIKCLYIIDNKTINLRRWWSVKNNSDM